jgi:microcystin degradation protein MlrC
MRSSHAALSSASASFCNALGMTFWDLGIAVFEDVRFAVRRLHEAPGEAVVVADVSVRAPGGASADYEAAIHYRLDNNGQISSLRAFWDLPAVVAQLGAGQQAREIPGTAR